jgi:hypothetical protein
MLGVRFYPSFQSATITIPRIRSSPWSVFAILIRARQLQENPQSKIGRTPLPLYRLTNSLESCNTRFQSFVPSVKLPPLESSILREAASVFV